MSIARLTHQWLRRIIGRSGGYPEQVRSVIVYSRAGCHLCETAIALLAKYRERFRLCISEIDVDAEATLRAKYDHCVPVVEIDGKVRFRGLVNEVLLVRLLRHDSAATP